MNNRMKLALLLFVAVSLVGVAGCAGHNPYVSTNTAYAEQHQSFLDELTEDERREFDENKRFFSKLDKKELPERVNIYLAEFPTCEDADPELVDNIKKAMHDGKVFACMTEKQAVVSFGFPHHNKRTRILTGWKQAWRYGHKAWTWNGLYVFIENGIVTSVE